MRKIILFLFFILICLIAFSDYVGKMTAFDQDYNNIVLAEDEEWGVDMFFRWRGWFGLGGASEYTQTLYINDPSRDYFTLSLGFAGIMTRMEATIQNVNAIKYSDSGQTRYK